MKLSTIRDIKKMSDEWKEIVKYMEESEKDFEVDDIRFIHSESIDQIQKDELSNDTYSLGCFQAYFIADITGLDYSVVEKAQETESFDLLGELMLQKIDEVQKVYSSLDGYGHHFNYYDGNEQEIGEYLVFINRAG